MNPNVPVGNVLKNPPVCEKFCDEGRYKKDRSQRFTKQSWAGHITSRHDFPCDSIGTIAPGTIICNDFAELSLGSDFFGVLSKFNYAAIVAKCDEWHGFRMLS
jgi:hypothetical protein